LIAAKDPAALWVVAAYLLLLLALSEVGRRRLRASSADYFVASRSIGPFLLLMSVFGTTMTAFALVGSTGEAWRKGIGVYGLMASTSGLVHSLVFFLCGTRLWAIGKRHGFVTQIQFLRARFGSELLGLVLFPVLVALVIPYVLIGILGAQATLRAVTAGMFPAVFPGELVAATGERAFVGALPPWLSGLVVCGVVLVYVVLGGVRAAALANACQTLVFMLVGLVAAVWIARSLGGPVAATRAVAERAPELLARDGRIGHLQFLSYALVPLSVAMFPHVFQHWLTARSARAFGLTVVAHPLCILIVWLPCILIGVWAAGTGLEFPGGPNSVLARMVSVHVDSPWVEGLLTAGILAAIMSSLDSQFVCVGTMFTHDVVVRLVGEGRLSDRQQVAVGRAFIVLVVAIAWLLSLFPPPSIFELAVWCFTGFSALAPLVLAALYWQRATAGGAVASVMTAAVLTVVLFADDAMRSPAEKAAAPEYLVFGMMPIVAVVLAATLSLVVVSLCTAPPERRTIERFFPESADPSRADA
jgi:SSS family solute:Na+ symporter